MSTAVITPEENENLLKTRLWIYRFLSQAFHGKPSWSAFEGVVEGNLFRLMLNNGDEGSNHGGLVLLAETLEAMPDWSLESWKEAEKEYQRLFYGPDPLPAKPWESVYLSRERIILDEHTLEVRAFYKNWGLETIRLNQEPEDHIGVELEFIANLTLRALDAIEKDGADVQAWEHFITAQQVFLEEHLLKWVDVFCQRLSESTDHPLYKGIALFTPEFLHMDFELLKDYSTGNK